MSQGYERLVNVATKFSIGYGLFLGAVQAPRKPKNLQDAQEEAKFSTFAKHAGRDMAIGLADDLVLPVAAGVLGQFHPKLRPYARTVGGLALAAGTGMAAAVFGHDFMNYMEARSVVRASGGDLSLPDYRMNAIDGFQNSGAGRVIRRQLTGIGSPAAQAIYHQIKYNPYANLLSTFTRTDHENQTGEAPFRNPVRAGLMLGEVAGYSGFLAASPLGYGRASLVGLLSQTAGGIYGVANSNADQTSKNMGYIAVAQNIAPSLVGFGTIQGLRQMRHLKGRLGFLGAIGTVADSGINKLAKAASNFGHDIGPEASIRASKYLLGKSEQYMHWTNRMIGSDATKALYANMTTKAAALGEISSSGGILGGAARLGQGILNKTAGFIDGGMADRELIARLSAKAERLSKSERFNLTEAKNRINNNYSRLNAIVHAPATMGMRGFNIAQNITHNAIFPLFSHVNQNTRWEQSLALGHLLVVGPHMAHTAHGLITGHVNTHGIINAPAERKRHRTTSMSSNRA